MLVSFLNTWVLQEKSQLFQIVYFIEMLYITLNQHVNTKSNLQYKYEE